MIRLEKRIALLAALGTHIQKRPEALAEVVRQTARLNPWFSEMNTWQALEGIATQYLDTEALTQWAKQYTIAEPKEIRTVGLVLAGNIPLVGFHDFLSVFVAGHKAQIKLSDKDKLLLPYCIGFMLELEPAFADYIQFVPRLKAFDAVIATGSDNTMRYFKQYFGSYPHILRGNRNGVALLTGEETDEMLRALGRDIFTYFGLGCRSVSKLYIPHGYDFQQFMRVMDEFQSVMEHHKYRNNFEYNRALYLMNGIPHWTNNCLLVTPDPRFESRIAALHYDFYEDWSTLGADLDAEAEAIQCAVTGKSVETEAVSVFDFGAAQTPRLTDYADGVDTLAFLRDI